MPSIFPSINLRSQEELPDTGVEIKFSDFVDYIPPTQYLNDDGTERFLVSYIWIFEGEGYDIVGSPNYATGNRNTNWLGGWQFTIQNLQQDPNYGWGPSWENAAIIFDDYDSSSPLYISISFTLQAFTQQYYSDGRPKHNYAHRLEDHHITFQIPGLFNDENNNIDLNQEINDDPLIMEDQRSYSALGGNDTVQLPSVEVPGYRDGTAFFGGADADKIYGGPLDDNIFGGTGNDVLEGHIGSDTLDGGEDRDYLDGGAGADSIIGGAGDDTLLGGYNIGLATVIDDNDVDELSGGAGTDFYYAGVGDKISELEFGEQVELLGTANIATHYYIYRSDGRVFLGAFSDSIIPTTVAEISQDFDPREISIFEPAGGNAVFIRNAGGPPAQTYATAESISKGVEELKSLVDAFATRADIAQFSGFLKLLTKEAKFKAADKSAEFLVNKYIDDPKLKKYLIKELPGLTSVIGIQSLIQNIILDYIYDYYEDDAAARVLSYTSALTSIAGPVGTAFQIGSFIIVEYVKSIIDIFGVAIQAINVILPKADDQSIVPSDAPDYIVIPSETQGASIEGSMSSLNGDYIYNFSQNDKIVVANETFGTEALTVKFGSAILEIDPNLDGLVDAVITLEGDFEGAEFKVQTYDHKTEISLATIPIDHSDSIESPPVEPPLATPKLDASDAEYEVHFGETFSGQLSAQDVDLSTLVFSASPDYPTDTGTLTIASEGTFTFVPDSARTGGAVFGFVVEDQEGARDTGLIRITYTWPESPVELPVEPPLATPKLDASDAEYEVHFGETFSGQLSAQDVDLSTLVFSASPDYPTDTGTLTIASEGTFTFVPDSARTGGAVFGFVVEDQEGVRDTGFIRITYTWPELPAEQPVAANQPSQEADTMSGSSSAETMSGLGGDDTMQAGGGDDTVLGGDGDDRMFGQGGNDRLVGQAGNDFAKGNGGDDFLKGSGGDDTLIGGGGDDSLRGNGGNDSLKGGGGDDTILGNGGADDIKGGGGDDVINAGRGDDTIKGNGGADTFQFRGNDGSNTINGFQQGQDLIEVLAGASEFGDLDISQDGRNVLIEFANVDITVTNARIDQFNEDDFIF